MPLSLWSKQPRRGCFRRIGIVGFRRRRCARETKKPAARQTFAP
jgi:hypothetical protein